MGVRRRGTARDGTARGSRTPATRTTASSAEAAGGTASDATNACGDNDYRAADLVCSRVTVVSSVVDNIVVRCGVVLGCRRGEVAAG
jgi:hypothetical protein